MIDLGAFTLDADKYGLTLHRKKLRTNKKTGEQYPYSELVGHYGTFAQVSARLAHMSAADAVTAGESLLVIRTVVDQAAQRIEQALITNQQGDDNHA